MSKRRVDVPEPTGDLAPSEGDLIPYVCFTQLKPEGPFVYAGWLDAADPRMAMYFAREHYGRDQACVGVWAIPRSAITGTDPEYAPRPGGSKDTFVVFRQDATTDKFLTVDRIEATDPAAALAAARAAHGGDDVLRLWVVAEPAIIANQADDLLWRLTDQSYRLARGYSKSVRQKWEKIRAEPDLEVYERDDLQETF